MKRKTKSTTTTIGTREYADAITGEITQFKVMSTQEQTDVNFHKIWLDDLVYLLKALGGGKVEVFCHLLENKNFENIYMGSISTISTKTKISESTVKSAIKLMKDLDYIRMVVHGVYQINPNLVVKGDSKKRQMLVRKYKEIKSA
jgi:hypothetical protein